MDPEIKQEFEKMGQKMSQEIEDLALVVKDGFEYLESRMATKDDLKALEAKMATKDDLKILENKMDSEFASVRSELKYIREKMSELEERLEKFMQTESEDVGACYEDLEDLKARVARIEKELQLQTA